MQNVYPKPISGQRRPDHAQSWRYGKWVALLATTFYLWSCSTSHQGRATPVMVTVQGSSLWALNDALARQGIKLVVFGHGLKRVVVPEELRYRSLPVTELLDGSSRAARGHCAFMNNGSLAVIYRRLPDDELAGIVRRLASKSTAERQEGVWLAKSAEDIRLVPTVVGAADDTDATVRELAQQALRQWGWGLVIALEPAAKQPFERDLANPNPEIHRRVLIFAPSLGSVKAEPILTAAMESGNWRTRNNAMWAFWRFVEPADMGYVLRTFRTGNRDIRFHIATGLVNTYCAEMRPVVELAINDKDHEVRKLALTALGNLPGEAAERILASRLEAEDSADRVAAVTAWAHAKGKTALPVLEKALKDQSPDVRHEAARSLGRVGGDRAVQLALGALGDPSSQVRGAALEALGDLGGPSAAQALTKAEAVDDGVREHLVNALLASPQESRLPLIEESLSSDNFSLGSNAAAALSRIAPEKAVPVVRRALVSPKRPRYAHYRELLQAVPQDNMLRMLDELLRDKEPRVRARACEATGEFGGDPALRLLTRAIEDPDTDVRGAACRALGMVGGPKALELLSKLLSREAQSAVNGDIVAALGTTGMPEAWRLVKEQLVSQDDNVRAGAIFALAADGQTDVRDVMEQALKDKGPEGRSAAVFAFVDWWPSEALEKIAPLLDDPDASVRRAVIRNLQPLGDQRIPELLSKRLRAETDRPTRQAILRSLRRFRDHPTVKSLLTELEQEERDAVTRD